jgi:hypothetical protein
MSPPLTAFPNTAFATLCAVTAGYAASNILGLSESLSESPSASPAVVPSASPSQLPSSVPLVSPSCSVDEGNVGGGGSVDEGKEAYDFLEEEGFLWLPKLPIHETSG